MIRRQCSLSVGALFIWSTQAFAGVDTQYWYDFHPQSVLRLGSGFDPSRPLEPKTECLEFGILPLASPNLGPEPTNTSAHPLATRSIAPGVSEQSRADGGALSTEVDVFLVRTMNEYREALGIDVSVEASYLGFSGGGAFKLAQSRTVQQNSLTILVRARSEYARRFSGVPRLTPLADQMIRNQEYGRFISVCGTHYATIERRAALAVIEIRVDSIDQSTRSSIEASASAAGGFGPMSASLRAKVTSELNRASREGRVNARIVAQGGEGISSAGEMISSVVSGGEPLEKAGQGLRRFVEGFRSETAAPISYAVAQIPFLPAGYAFSSDIAKRDRMLAIADLYRNVAQDFLKLSRLLNRVDLRWRAFPVPLIEMVRTELPGLESLLERIRETHQMCGKTQENWESACGVPEAVYTRGLDTVLGILAISEEVTSG